MSRRLNGRVASNALGCWLALAPLYAQAQDALLVRSLTRNLGEPFVRAIAQAGAPTEPGTFPVAGRKPDEIVALLCGSIQPGYFDEVKRLNGPVDRDATEGMDKLRWPACVKLQPLANAAPKTQPSLAEAPAVPIRPFPGKALDDLKKALVDAVDAHGEDLDWEVVSPAKNANVITAYQPACPTTRPPYDGQAVAAYYDLAVRKRGALGPVVAWVFDNGFYGHDAQAAKPWSDAFPALLFVDWSKEDPPIGPSYGLGETISPSNYVYVAVPTDVSGHGTHVLGLVLGGESFVGYRSRFLVDPEDESKGAWLHLGVTNLAKGGQILLEGSEKQLFAQLGDPRGLDRGRIINLSLVYPEPPGKDFVATFSQLYAQKRDLFVVAAGNDGDTISNQFPAKLGGATGVNVITVAAHDDGDPQKLTGFTNKGDFVDIAAPGCSVKSWLGIDATTLTPLTGSSQAAPIVTFTAALLRSLDTDLWPGDLKARLLAAADLMPATTKPRLKLNIAKSLLAKYDFVRLKNGETYIGTIDKVRGLRCVGDTGQIAFDGYQLKDVLSYKWDAAAPVFVNARANSAALCDADVSRLPLSKAPGIWFTPDYRLLPFDTPANPDGSRTYFTSPGSNERRPIDFEAIAEIVMHAPEAGRFRGAGK